MVKYNKHNERELYEKEACIRIIDSYVNSNTYRLRKNNQQPAQTLIEDISVKTEKEEVSAESKATEAETKDKENAADTSPQDDNSADEEDLYLNYVLGKTITSDGAEVVYLLDQIDYENWQVPVEGAQPGDVNEFGYIRVLGIDWNTDGTIKQVIFSDFTFPNTFGTMEAPGTSGTLNVKSWAMIRETGTQSFRLGLYQ